MDAGTFTRAMHAAMKAAPAFKGCVVTRGEQVNTDPDFAVQGWFGVYKKGTDYNPLTLAANNPGRYDVACELVVVAQSVAYGGKDGEGAAADDKLEERIAAVVDLLLTDETLQQLIERITKVSVMYEYRPVKLRDQRVFMPTAYISITLEVQNA